MNKNSLVGVGVIDFDGTRRVVAVLPLRDLELNDKESETLALVDKQARMGHANPIWRWGRGFIVPPGFFAYRRSRRTGLPRVSYTQAARIVEPLDPFGQNYDE